MNPFKILKRVKPNHFFSLFRLVASHLLFIWPTYRATKKTMALATQHFGSEHYKNGPANAFRHALWNYAIAKECTKWSKNYDRILCWTKNITDWHERAFFGQTLSGIMDFHNNKVGRSLFLEHRTSAFQTVIDVLLERTQGSTPITETTNLNELKNHLVHIRDED